MREFALRLAAPVADVLDHCAERGVNAGYQLGLDYPEFADGLLVAITEQRSRADIDHLADVLEGALRRDSRDRARGGAGMSAQSHARRHRPTTRRRCSATRS